MIHVRSNGFSKDLPYREGMTVATALDEAGVRRRFRQKVFVGDSTVRNSETLKDDDTVTVAPRIRNG